MMAATEFPGPYILKSETDFRRYYRRIPLIYAALTVLQFLLLIKISVQFPVVLLLWIQYVYNT